MALARAHDLTLPNLSEGGAKTDRSTTLPALVRTIIAPYTAEGHTLVTIEGPDVPVGSGAVMSIALLLHEIATNAAKYGALSSQDGYLDVSWCVAKDELQLKWQERGGPPVNGQPESEGFGTLLARLTVTGQLAGKISYDWNQEGLTVNLSAPLERLAK
jgi:two-component system CheB/CheR fusion protein